MVKRNIFSGKGRSGNFSKPVDRTKNLIGQFKQVSNDKQVSKLKKQEEIRTPISEGMYLPNLSGMSKHPEAKKIDHDTLFNYVANQHIDWTNASSNFVTSGTIESTANSVPAIMCTRSAGAAIALRRSSLPGQGQDLGVVDFQGETTSRGVRILAEAKSAWSAGTSFPSMLTIQLVLSGTSLSDVAVFDLNGITTKVNMNIDGNLNHDGSNIGVFGTTPTTKQTVTGSRGGNAALASLLTALANYGLITDSSTA